MRRQISWLVIATTSAVVVSFVIPLCLLVRTLAQDRAMTAATDEARSAAVLVASIPGDRRLATFIADLDAHGAPRTSVLNPHGRVLGTQIDDLADDPEVRRALAGESFEVIDDAGGRVLVPVEGADGTFVVRTAVTYEDLREGVAGAWTAIVGLGAILIALSLLIARSLGNRVSRPLREVADTAHRLRAGDLEARADVSGTTETQELARALNGLADRTAELLATERAAVGDLSHRLRTPVTALRLDAEAVADPALAERLATHVGALQRSIDQIVKEARRPVRSDLTARCDAVAVVRERLDHWSALAEDQNRLLRVDLADSPVAVALAATDLADLVDILIDNVFAHTEEGTPFSVGLTVTDELLELSVSDDGPGISGQPGTRPGSTGLGLDIVRRTAGHAGGSVHIGPGASGGTRVRLVIPVVTDAG